MASQIAYEAGNMVTSIQSRKVKKVDIKTLVIMANHIKSM